LAVGGPTPANRPESGVSSEGGGAGDSTFVDPVPIQSATQKGNLRSVSQQPTKPEQEKLGKEICMAKPTRQNGTILVDLKEKMTKKKMK